MSHHDQLDTELQRILEAFKASGPLARLHAGEIGVNHYASHLRQNYFQLRERPVILGLAAARLMRSPASAKLLHKRATEEIFHDQLALNDLRALGADTAGIECELPLPETVALLAYGHYQIERLNPVGIIGSMYFLDFVPFYASMQIEGDLKRIGVPEEAMSALEDHEVTYPMHAEALRTHVDELVVTDEDLAAVRYGMHTTATLYANMIVAAFAAVDASA